MNVYSIQCYFKNLCLTHQVAYDELKRLKNWDSLNIKDLAKWEGLLSRMQKQIYDCINLIRRKELQIIISKQEEVYALIGYFAQTPEHEYDFIKNTCDCNRILPNNNVCNEFMRAYCYRNDEAMRKLYAVTYEEDIF